MTAARQAQGAGVVGRLTDIPPCEAALIRAVRFWMHGPEGRAEVWNGFARCFGPREGRAEMRAFETMIKGVCAHARRPLAPHGPGCNCVGSDEAILCTLVREAARGDLAEAAAIASLIVPARHAEPTALMAAGVGRAMQRLAQGAPALQPGPCRAEHRTLH
jgi:hypothetical protein